MPGVKISIRIGSKPKLKFYDLLGATADAFTQYPDWVTDRLKVVLQDTARHCSLAIAFDSASYEQDNPDVELEDARVAEAVTKVSAGLNLSEYTRFGCRRWYMVPVKLEFESLVKVLAAKFFSADISEALPHRIDDLMYRVDTSDDYLKYHITIGPVKKAEVPTYIPLNAQMNFARNERQEALFQIQEGYPDVALIADVDAYKIGEPLTRKELDAFAFGTRRRLDDLIIKMTAFLFRQHLED